MIDEREIRIGNLFTHTDAWSSAGHNGEFFWSASDWADLSECTLNLEEVSPVPVTPETLERFGFKRIGSGQDFNIKGLFLHGRKRGYMVRRNVPVMAYIHQLQNYFFAATGRELEEVKTIEHEPHSRY